MASSLAKRSLEDRHDARKVPRLGEFSSFPIHPLSKYHGNCAVYKQPVELQSYSIDHERAVHFDDRQLVSNISRQ
jgi:hypothetical protein